MKVLARGNPCFSICESNFIQIYEKFDKFSEYVIDSLNKTSVDLSKELTEIVDEMSLVLMIKLKRNIEKISHQHSRLEATSRVLEQLFEKEEFITETRDIKLGLNVYQFILLCIIFLCIGINIETIRLRRKEYNLT